MAISDAAYRSRIQILVPGFAGNPRRRTTMRLPTQKVLESSNRYLDLIAGKPMSEAESHAFINETVDAYEKHVNRGFISYRKSVTEAGQFAALEWSGHGSMVRDLLGREYIDCPGGFGIFSAGINHPRVVKAVTDQLKRMALNSQELLEPWRAALAKLLSDITPGELSCSFFINNGTDAVEGAIKLARLYTGRNTFLSTLGGFHGKSMGSLSLMGKATFREPFCGGLQDVRFAPYGDAIALRAEFEKAEAVGTPIAAFIVEPVQGEAGAIVPPPDYLPQARELCDRFGALLIADEIQTGMGRTGKLWGVDHSDVAPDIMCVGKSIGGGVMPLAAFISTPKIWEVLVPNPVIHSTTFGGNPIACAAGIAAINVTLEEDLPGQAAAKGHLLIKGLKDLQARFPGVLTAVRGRGLLIGLEFPSDPIGYEFAAGLFRRGVLVAGTYSKARTIRIEPSLDIPTALLNELLNRAEDTLREIGAPKLPPRAMASPAAFEPMLEHDRV
jgi:putrescine aminotransferase